MWTEAEYKNGESKVYEDVDKMFADMGINTDEI